MRQRDARERRVVERGGHRRGIVFAPNSQSPSSGRTRIAGPLDAPATAARGVYARNIGAATSASAPIAQPCTESRRERETECAAPGGSW